MWATQVPAACENKVVKRWLKWMSKDQVNEAHSRGEFVFAAYHRSLTKTTKKETRKEEKKEREKEIKRSFQEKKKERGRTGALSVEEETHLYNFLYNKHIDNWLKISIQKL